MKLAAATLLLGLLWQASPHVAPEPRHFRFERGIEANAQPGSRSCAVLDGSTYAHAKPALADVRLFGADEIPYALTMSETAATGDAAKLLNLGESGGHIVFDLQMPTRPYSAVDLDLNGQNFLATAKVTGLNSLGKAACCTAGTSLGTFTLFDLTAQRLGRSTSLALAESTFPFLHVDLAASAAPGHPGFAPTPDMVQGATVPPSREAQTLYTTIASTSTIQQVDRSSVATFDLPAHVPVERVSFEMEPGDKTNFSRPVQVTARAADGPDSSGRGAAFSENIDGTITRVRLTEAGKEIRHESLDIPATLGSNGQKAAKVQVAVENGDDKPLPIRAVKLEMRQRKLCFDAPSAPVTMYYGDDKLTAPVYDYSRLFQPADASASAQLQPEQPNPLYVARLEQRSLTERHPEILWLALFAVVSVLGLVAFRSAKRI